jgi:hypothetical protein
VIVVVLPEPFESQIQRLAAARHEARYEFGATETRKLPSGGVIESTRATRAPSIFQLRALDAASLVVQESANKLLDEGHVDVCRLLLRESASACDIGYMSGDDATICRAIRNMRFKGGTEVLIGDAMLVAPWQPDEDFDGMLTSSGWAPRHNGCRVHLAVGDVGVPLT